MLLRVTVRLHCLATTELLVSYMSLARNRLTVQTRVLSNHGTLLLECIGLQGASFLDVVLVALLLRLLRTVDIVSLVGLSVRLAIGAPLTGAALTLLGDELLEGAGNSLLSIVLDLHPHFLEELVVLVDLDVDALLL